MLDAARLGMLAVVTALVGSMLPAQEAPPGPSKGLVIRGGRLLLDVSAAPKEGVLVIRDGKIVAAGAHAEVPPGLKVIEARGCVVAPSWIDAGNLGLLDPSSWKAGPGDAKDRVTDMIAAFDSRPRHQLLREGVGIVYLDLLPRGRGFKGPTGAVGMVRPEGADLPMLASEGGVTFRIGGRQRTESNVLTRKSSIKGITAALDSAARYKKAQDKYRKDLKAYEKALAEWKKSGGKKTESEPKKAGSKKKESGSGGRSRGRRPPLPPDFKDWSREKKAEWFRKQMEQRRQRGPEPKDETAGATAKDGRPKKPLNPKSDPGDEALVRVLDGKIPLRVEAHWREDILAALELARTKKVRLVLLGACEAWRCLDEIKKQHAGVVLGPSLVLGGDPLDSVGFRSDLAARLAEAEIPFAFMTAGSAGFRHDSLSLIASLAMASGLSLEDTLEALTTGAATVIGLSDRVGRLAPGQEAAIQILSGDPLDPSTRVVRFVLGSEVIEIDGRTN